MHLYEQLALDLKSLVVFRKLLQDEVVLRLCLLLESAELSPSLRVARYSDFMASLLRHGDNLTDYLKHRVCHDDNQYIRLLAQGKQAGDTLRACTYEELKKLERISQLSSKDICCSLGYAGYLPKWKTTTASFTTAFDQALGEVHIRGYGMFSEHTMFTFQNGVLHPISYPDSIRLGDLYGYEAQRDEVIRNTLALVSGKPAANTLLYGDAGTGKSSTVKALVNEYAHKGLRLIELTKKQLHEIPDIISPLSDNPLKFILFIDDLSFTSVGDDFNTLKAVLEGSASARSASFAIYATSNRRHLIKERFSDRDGDDIHRNETMQELCSLSDRFGLSIGFYKPDKQQYLNLVLALKNRHEIEIDDAVLFLEAERFATMRGGRSPRTATQFIAQLINE